jgi:3-phenylpropionate/trans-cinnamate dioxygenase ferredoxin subunit
MAWQFAAHASDLGERGMAGVTCDGVPLALCRIRQGDGEQYFALFDRCPHQGAALSEGELVDGFVECPRHAALFDVRSGASDGSVTTIGVRAFPARLSGGMIEVDLEGARGGIAG